jgi:CBS domain-containing protein
MRLDIHADSSIGSVMTGSVASIDAQATLRDAARALRLAEVGTLVIMDDAEIAGILSERDIIRALAEGVSPDVGRVADVMTRDPRYLTLGDHVATAVEIMLDAGIRHLPVIEEGELIGIVSIRDLAASMATMAATV